MGLPLAFESQIKQADSLTALISMCHTERMPKL